MASRKSCIALSIARKTSGAMSERELASEVEQYLGNRPVEEQGVWVYYPWKKTLVHLLDRDEFVFLRTNRNRNKITEEEQQILSKKAVGIVGLSVGQQHVMEIVQYDHLSPRMKESLGQIGESILTWPQLASSVLLGAASGAAVCRRISLGQPCRSGRYYLDVEQLLGDENEE